MNNKTKKSRKNYDTEKPLQFFPDFPLQVPVRQPAQVVLNAPPESSPGKGQPEVPIWQKMTLSIREAAAYSNIGINKIDTMLRTPNCPFVLFVGTKKLVKRQAFEEYISKKLVI